MAETKLLKVKLAAADCDWLQAEAEAMGLLDASDFLRVIVRERRVRGAAPVESPRATSSRADVAAGLMRRWAGSTVDVPYVASDDDDYTPTEEVDVPADVDDDAPAFEALMRLTGGSLLSGNPGPASGARPFSATRPSGVAPGIGSGAQMGDARGNLVRENFSHLGFRGGSK